MWGGGGDEEAPNTLGLDSIISLSTKNCITNIP
jgi:hypothetical protein